MYFCRKYLVMNKKLIILLVLFLCSAVNSSGESVCRNMPINMLYTISNEPQASDYYEKGLKLYQAGKQKECLTCMIKAIELWDEEIDVNATAGDACMLVGRIYFNNKQFVEAQKYADKALDIVTEIYDMDNSIESAKAYRFLGETYFMQDKYDDAYMNFAAAYEIAKNLLGEKHKEVKQIELLLTASYSKMTGK